MAEYYPLMSRAVAGLRTGTPEARQAIYGRAKQALLTQLRSHTPPVAEEDIAREVTALDAAVARVEEEIAARAKTPAGPTEPTVAPTPAPPAAPPTITQPQQAAATPSETSPGNSTPAVAFTRPRPLFSARSDLPPLRNPAAKTPAEPGKDARPRPSVPINPRPEPALPGSATPASAPPAATPPAATSPVPAAGPSPAPVRVPAAPPPPANPPVAAQDSTPPPLPAAPTLAVASPPEVAPAEPPVAPAVQAPSEVEQQPQIDLQPSPVEPASVRPRDDGARPMAPRLVEARRRNLSVWIVAAAALAAVIAIAFTAWKLRDRPEELERVPVAAQPQAPAPGKIVERADGSGAVDPDLSDAAPTATDPQAAPPAAVNTAEPASTAGAPASAASTAGPVVSQPTSPDPGIPIAYKAAILVDAPDTADRVKTYVGTVVWHTESVGQGQDQPLGTAVRADVSVPEVKLDLVVEIRKNNEAQFPASHTIELKFTLASDSSLGGVKQIGVPQMRGQDAPTGDALTGVPVAITDNHFLVGLTRGEAEARNVEFLRSREWIDVPFLLADNRPAKITFEKGALGKQIIDEALQSWGRS